MLNLVFTAIFILEGIVRILALRVGYFFSPWNVFDFVIVICSIIGIILENLSQALPISPSLLRVVRVFRVGRLLRFFEAAKGIRRLLFSLIISLPALINIGALLFLVIFIYSIIGMSLFGHVKKTDPLNEVVNFEYFSSSFLLLFRIMTSAGWNDILSPLMIQPPDCDPNYKNLPNGNCGYKLVSILFLVSFIVVIFLILINMYIAIILENYNQVMEQEKIGITNEDIDLFYQQWELYDPNATQFIEYKDLSDFVHHLEGSLRIPKPNKAACALMDIPLVNGTMIHCLDLMQGVVKRIVSRFEDVESEGFRLVMQNMEERFRAAFPLRSRHISTNTTMAINRQVAAAKVIIRAIRQHRERKLLAALQARILEEREGTNQGFVDDEINEKKIGSDVSVITNDERNDTVATEPRLQAVDITDAGDDTKTSAQDDSDKGQSLARPVSRRSTVAWAEEFEKEPRLGEHEKQTDEHENSVELVNEAGS
ncbi:hypothetical protein QZH41_000742 [Actinostola sp. cb2023]|nr:hypothetical protein QZH41_000742 [Actinostola sp. cb2023]